MEFSLQEHWCGLPFPPLVDHVLLELFTMTHPSRVALHSMAHSFIELCKPLCHGKAVIHEGGNFLWLQIINTQLIHCFFLHRNVANNNLFHFVSFMAFLKYLTYFTCLSVGSIVLIALKHLHPTVYKHPAFKCASSLLIQPFGNSYIGISH